MGGRVRPRDVIAQLAQQGVTVSSAQVSTVLASMGMKRRRRGRRPAAAAVVESVTSTLTLDSLLAAKRLVNQLGSVEAAKTAVDALAKLG
jgi:arginine repressor